MKHRLYVIGPVAAAAVTAGSVLAPEPQRGEAAPRAKAIEVASKSPVNRMPVPKAPAPSRGRRTSRAGSPTRSPADSSTPATCACTPSSAATARRCC